MAGANDGAELGVRTLSYRTATAAGDTKRQKEDLDEVEDSVDGSVFGPLPLTQAAGERLPWVLRGAGGTYPPFRNPLKFLWYSYLPWVRTLHCGVL